MSAPGHPNAALRKAVARAGEILARPAEAFVSWSSHSKHRQLYCQNLAVWAESFITQRTGVETDREVLRLHCEQIIAEAHRCSLDAIEHSSARLPDIDTAPQA